MPICVNCRGRVVFDADGWTHHNTESTCDQISVSWPSPEDLVEDDVADPAA